MVLIGIGALVVPAFLGAGLCWTSHRRTHNEARRLPTAQFGEDLLSALASLPGRCGVLLTSAEQLARAYHLSAADQRNLVAGLEECSGRIRNLEQQVRQVLEDLMALRGDAIEERSDRLGTLDTEICLLTAEIDDREALWSAELATVS